MLHLLLIVGLVPWLPSVCRLLPAFVYRGFPSTPPVASPPRIPSVGFSSTPPVAPPPPVPLGIPHDGCAALLAQLCLILVSPLHEPFVCFKDPPGTTSPPFSLQWTIVRSQLYSPRGSVPLILRWLGTPHRSSTAMHLQYLCMSARCRVLPASRRPEHYSTGQSLLALPCHGPRIKEPPFTDDRFDALATCHLEGLRVRDGDVVCTRSALEANMARKRTRW